MCQPERRRQALRRERGAAERPGEGKRECLHTDEQGRRREEHGTEFPFQQVPLLRVFDGAKRENRLHKPVIAPANSFLKSLYILS